jgi:cytosine/adenosine deaminase-related metal-dependent hydrolase
MPDQDPASTIVRLIQEAAARAAPSATPAQPLPQAIHISGHGNVIAGGPVHAHIHIHVQEPPRMARR